MTSNSLCLHVSKGMAEGFRRLLKQLNLIDLRRRIIVEGRFVDIPLIREPDLREWMLLRELSSEATIVNVDPKLLERAQHPRNVVDLLRNQIDQSLLPQIKHSFDVIGEIAIIEVPPELSSLKELIAKAIVEVHRGVKTVLCKRGAVDGKYRVRGYELLFGNPQTETTHREHGCRYILDVTKVYFSPRLATEHLRVASQVTAGEVVLDMFAGIGPFSILIAKKRKVGVYAIDVNPTAVKYLRMNCALNKVEQLVKPILGDARNVVTESLMRVADRVIMNLPSESLGFVDVACSALKSGGGVIHSYQFQSTPNPVEHAVEALRVRVEAAGRDLRATCGGRLVRSVAPHEWQVAVDVVVR